MSLATVDAEGRPSLRTVLAKQFDARGCLLHEPGQPQGHEIAANTERLAPVSLAGSRAAGDPVWSARDFTAETLAYFLKRPIDSQLAPGLPQATSSPPKNLEMKWEEMKRKFADGRVPLPSFWAGTGCPRTFEFWQAGPTVARSFPYSGNDGS